MLSRRAILAGAAALSASPLAARAQTSPPPTILKLERRDIEVNGRTASVFGIRQPNGTFGLITDVGKPFRVRVENGIDEPSLIHWHGLTPPWRQDGVPGISGPPIPPGGSADYDFPLRFGGTFWMHSHQGLQEQVLMTAPLIIHDQRDRADQQEVVIMLADFSFTPPEEIYANLRKSGSMAGVGDEKGGSKMIDVEHEIGAAGRPRSQRCQIRRLPRQFPHPRRSRARQSRAGRTGAAADHQQRLDEQLPYRSRRARRRIDRRRRFRGRAGSRPPLSGRGRAAPRHPGHAPAGAGRLSGAGPVGRRTRPDRNRAARRETQRSPVRPSGRRRPRRR